MQHHVTYQIRIDGWIAQRWAAWLGDVDAALDHESDGAAVSTLTVTVVDQADLRGILAKIWDLNLELLSVARTTPRRANEAQEGRSTDTFPGGSHLESDVSGPTPKESWNE